MKISVLFQLKFILLLTSTVICSFLYGNETGKPAVIITQDGEVDDRSSFVRFLLYTPDIDLRGVIATNFKWQKNGHGLDWIYKAYDLYVQVRDNLLLHNIYDVRFRNVENDFGLVGGIYFSTFHGGNSADWAPRNDSYAQFDGFVIANNRVELYND